LGRHLIIAFANQQLSKSSCGRLGLRSNAVMRRLP
jgi:hypothetical protein